MEQTPFETSPGWGNAKESGDRVTLPSATGFRRSCGGTSTKDPEFASGCKKDPEGGRDAFAIKQK
jgi:hypothetical protein